MSSVAVFFISHLSITVAKTETAFNVQFHLKAEITDSGSYRMFFCLLFVPNVS